MSLAGKTVGHIRLDEVLGRGGMGEVYRGFDERLQRVVAVKTIHAEHRLSGTARSRFLREARILSKLAHPSICQVYDLIEADDADYLILEFVEGETVEHRRNARAMAEREVLELGVRIAEALAVAHRERIIHRDLKPANIMVTPSGAIKVLDFGIARSTLDEVAGPPDVEPDPATRLDSAADPERTIAQATAAAASTDLSGALTQQGSIVGTVHYMSPEQASGRELTEASDMFSFGIVLQELLTGMAVYPAEPLPFLLMRVADCESYPITGVDPDVARLVEDLKHPTPSRRPTAPQALARLHEILDKPQRLRRRRLKIAALSTAFALLVVVLAVVTFLAVREKRARGEAERFAGERDREAERANREAKTANRVVQFLVELFDEADPTRARGREISVREIVELGGKRISGRLADEPLVRARLQETLGGITWRLGDYDSAVGLLDQARAGIERERGADDPALAPVLALAGAIRVDLGRYDEAEAELRRAEALYDRQAKPPLEERARLDNYFGALADGRGDLDEADRRYAGALARLRAQERPPARDVALTLNNLAIIAWRRADYRAASDYYRESLALNEELLGADHPHVAAQLNNLGILARDLGDYAESERLHRRALAIAEKALGGEHADVASILNSLARLYGRQERLDEGIALLERALQICRKVFPQGHAETATTELRLGDFARRAGQLGRAARSIPGARGRLVESLGGDHPRLVEAWTAEGRLLAALGRRNEARRAFLEGERIGRLTLGADHPDVRALAQELADGGELQETSGSGGPP